MSNRIKHLRVRDRTVPPSDAELTVEVVPEHASPTAELRGRVTGPVCAYADTIEVAYPLRGVASAQADTLTARAVIPEASLWDPARPFLYRVFVELCQDGRRCDQRRFEHGFRTLGLVGWQGLRLNGEPLFIRGVAFASGLATGALLNEAEVRGLRQAGYNLILAPPANADLWGLADRLGMFVLGQVKEEVDLERVESLSAHPCCFGWLLTGRPLPGPAAIEALASRLRTIQGAFLGSEDPEFSPRATEVDFFVCEPGDFERNRTPKPIIVWGPRAPAPEDRVEGLLGGIELKPG